MRAGKAHGFALIDLIFVVGIIGVLASVGLPSMLQARQSAAGASAIGSMRSINSSELTFALTCGNGFYAPSLTSLGYPAVGSHEPFLGGGLTSADTIIKSAYSFTLEGDPYAEKYFPRHNFLPNGHPQRRSTRGTPIFHSRGVACGREHRN